MLQEQQVVMSATRSEDAWSGFSFSMSLDVIGALDAADGSPLELPAVDSGSDGQVSGEKGSDDMARMDREDSWPQTEVEQVLGDTMGDPERLDATMALLHIVADSAGSCDKTGPEDLADPSDEDISLDGALLMRVRSVLRAMDKERGRQEELIGLLERLAGVGRLRGTLVMLKGVITDTKVARQRSSLPSDEGPESVGPPVAKLQRKATVSALRALLPGDMEWGTVDDHLSRIFTSILEPAHEDAPSVEQHTPQGITTEPVLDPATHFTYHSEGLSSIPYDHLVSAPVDPVTHFPFAEQQPPLPPPPSSMAPLPAPMLYDHHLHAPPQPVDMSVPCQSGEAGGMGMPTMQYQQQHHQHVRPQPFMHLTSPNAHPITLEHAHEIPPSTPCYPSHMPPYVPLVSPSAGGHQAPMYGPPPMMMPPPPPHTMSPHTPVEHPYPPQYVAYPPPSPYMVPMSPGMPLSPPFHMGAMGPLPSPQQHMMENIPNGQHQGYWHAGVAHPFDDKPKKGGNKRGDYRCGKCGELKRNHTCKKVVKETREMASQVDECLTLATRAETPVLPGSWPAAFIAVTPAAPAPVEESTPAAKPGRARAMSAGIVASV